MELRSSFMIFYNHPYSHIVELLKSLPESNIEFSIYEYQPQTIFDNRTMLSIHPSEFSAEWLSEKISSLNTNEELAFHSKLVRSGRSVHVPMIDLDCPIQELDLAKSTLRKVLPPYIFSGLRFYNSGRSLHAYGSCILTRTKWIEYGMYIAS